MDQGMRVVFRSRALRIVWDVAVSLAAFVLLILPGLYIAGFRNAGAYIYARAGVLGIIVVLVIILSFALMIRHSLKDDALRRRLFTTVPRK